MKCIFPILLLMLSPLLAQEQTYPVSEKRARVKTISELYQGMVISVDTTSLQLKLEESAVTKTFPRRSIEEIELFVGEKPLGAALGFGLGALLGFAIGYAIEPPEDVPQYQAAGGYALVGGLAGAVFGLIEKSEQWQEVSYEQLLMEK